MKSKIRILHKLLLSAVLLCCIIVVASCGAVVDTELVADKDFSGSRIISATLSSSDLSGYVTGGAEAIENTIKKYIPDPLTYTITETSDKFVCTFRLEFSDIDDYREKVSSILEAGKSYAVPADIDYIYQDSPFKNGLLFKESFSSMDLIGWFRYGLEQEDIISEKNSSNWFETGDTKVILGGESYNCSDSIEVDQSTYNTPDSINIKTYFLPDGNFDRTIDFRFAKETVSALKKQSFDPEEYLKGLVTASVVEKTVSDYHTTYTVKMKGLSAEGISAETAKVLQSENVSFSSSMTADEDTEMRMLISVSEKLDGSYYLRRESDLTNSYILFDNTKVMETGGIGFSSFMESDKPGYSYCPPAADEKGCDFTFAWDVDFSRTGAVLGIKNEKIELDIKFSAPAESVDSVKLMLCDSLAAAVPEGADLHIADEDGFTVYTVDFGTADTKEAAALFKKFIANYTGSQAECSFEAAKGVSPSVFRSINTYSAVIDMRSLSDKPMEFTFIKSGELFVLENSKITPYSELAAEYKKFFSGRVTEEQAAVLAELEAKADTENFSGVFDGVVYFYALEESKNDLAYAMVIILVVSLLLAIVFALIAIKVGMPSETITTTGKTTSGNPEAIPEKSSASEKDEDEDEKSDDEAEDSAGDENSDDVIVAEDADVIVAEDADVVVQDDEEDDEKDKEKTDDNEIIVPEDELIQVDESGETDSAANDTDEKEENE